MEDSGDAIEHMLFGFRIQHCGAADPKFHVCILNHPPHATDVSLS
jgi:hypothetical protein